MSKKLIAIATGDWHIHNWKQFNQNDRRLKLGIKIIKDFFLLSVSHKVPILFTGDLLHTPKDISNKLLDVITETFKECFENMPDAMFYAISGNHDMSEVNTKIDKSPSYIQTLSRVFPNFRCIDFKGFTPKNMREAGIVLYGIPYIDHNVNYEDILNGFTYWEGKKNILLVHTNLYGASDPSGYDIGETENIPRNMGKFFKKFDLVLSGHIHKYNELVPRRIYMVGAPCQQRKSDMGCAMGYLNIYDDLSTEFIKTEYPEFKEYEPSTEPTNDYDFWILKEQQKTIEVENKGFSTDLSRKIIAKRYLKVKGIDSNLKRRALISLLDSIE